jgi:CheY-like chemotaxis protein
MLRNLISNAIKYTERGRVELRCAHDGEDLRIEVRDSGIGIPVDQLGCIFDEFYQVGVAPNSSRNGYGLGLSIVQRIARLLGIAVEVASKPGQGSVFSFRLPLAAAPAAVEPARATAPVNPVASDGGAAILLVEDDPGVRNAMRMFLKLEGFRVTPVANFTEATERLRGEERFDIVVTDYHLEKGRTGTQVIEAARALRGAELKAILVTGDTSSAVRELRGDKHLRIISKPINSGEFLRLIQDLLAG